MRVKKNSPSGRTELALFLLYLMFIFRFSQSYSHQRTSLQLVDKALVTSVAKFL